MLLINRTRLIFGLSLRQRNDSKTGMVGNIRWTILNKEKLDHKYNGRDLWRYTLVMTEHGVDSTPRIVVCPNDNNQEIGEAFIDGMTWTRPERWFKL